MPFRFVARLRDDYVMEGTVVDQLEEARRQLERARNMVDVAIRWRGKKPDKVRSALALATEAFRRAADILNSNTLRTEGAEGEEQRE